MKSRPHVQYLSVQGFHPKAIYYSYTKTRASTRRVYAMTLKSKKIIFILGSLQWSHNAQRGLKVLCIIYLEFLFGRKNRPEGVSDSVIVRIKSELLVLKIIRDTVGSLA